MTNNSDNNSIQFRLFTVDSLQLAVSEELITTAVDWTEPTPLPFGPKAVLGVVCIQGRMFTVVDLVKLLRPETDIQSTPQSILALRGDEQLALAVGTAEHSIDLPATSLQSSDEDTSNLLPATFSHEGKDWQVLNVDELFNSLVQGRERRRRRT
jgi:chemotaxis signal transduction protein